MFPHKLDLFEHVSHNKHVYAIQRLAVLMETVCVPYAVGT
jgi:hypothetical protein